MVLARTMRLAISSGVGLMVGMMSPVATCAAQCRVRRIACCRQEPRRAMVRNRWRPRHQTMPTAAKRGAMVPIELLNIVEGVTMNGAHALVHTLVDAGVDTCFANPGTSEMHFVAALDRVPGMRCVLGLFE